MDESEELREFMKSPLFRREDQMTSIDAIARKSGLEPVFANTLGLMAAKRRLSSVRSMIGAFKVLLAEERDEASAEVTSARKLSDAERKSLKTMLARKLGREVSLQEKLDETLIGGLIVRIGSTLIDSSVRGKLARYQNAMKEAR